ncbi:MAG: hypothetical protein AAFU67_08400, partial [Bacteroidota bacterium]
FNRPLATLDTSLAQIAEDTLPAGLSYTHFIDTSQANRIVFERSWKEATSYTITLLPGAITDIYNQQNIDTLEIDFNVVEQKSLGTLNLSIVGLDSTTAYVMRLVKGNNRDFIEDFIVVEQASFERILAGLPPADYKLEVISDRNRNGRYDGADWDQQRLPEEVRIFPLEALRANWEVDAQVDVGSGDEE